MSTLIHDATVRLAPLLKLISIEGWTLESDPEPFLSAMFLSRAEHHWLWLGPTDSGSPRPIRQRGQRVSPTLALADQLYPRLPPGLTFHRNVSYCKHRLCVNPFHHEIAPYGRPKRIKRPTMDQVIASVPDYQDPIFDRIRAEAGSDDPAAVVDLIPDFRDRDYRATPFEYIQQDFPSATQAELTWLYRYVYETAPPWA